MARDIYTADMGNPPSPNEGPTADVKKKPVRKEPRREGQTEIYTAAMGNPPSPDEGPTMDVRPRVRPRPAPMGAPKPYAKGGSVGSASRRADGIAQRGKTKGRLI